MWNFDRPRFGRLGYLAIAATILLPAPAHADPTEQANEIIRLWPGAPPGTEAWTGPEIDQAGEVAAGKIRVKTNVTVPAMEVVRPEPGKANGTAMLVLPGGAFMALAWDLEGTEVAKWLADRGITAFILKYRVRGLQLPPGQSPPKETNELIKLLEPARKIAVADASQAVRILRERSGQLGIDADRIGMIGFSAGAATTMGVLLEAEPVARPNFAAPIYGMSLTAGDPPAPADAPPIFIAQAQDDELLSSERSIHIFEKWTEAKRPAELHIYTSGRHGFGMRQKDKPVGQWPNAFEAWLKSQGLLAPKNAASSRKQ